MKPPTNGPHIRPVRDLRNNYAELKEIIENHEPVFITNNGRGEAVLINIEDYRAYEAFRFEQYVLEAIEEAEENERNNPGRPMISLEDAMRESRAKLEAMFADEGCAEDHREAL